MKFKISKIPSYFHYVYGVIKYVKIEDWVHVFQDLSFDTPNRINFKDGSYSEHAPSMGLLEFLKYKKRKIDDNIFEWEMNGRQIIATPDQIAYIENELFSGLLETFNGCDVKNKRVLDVGGFIGETALIFIKNGALSVDVYESELKNYTVALINAREHSSIKNIHLEVCKQNIKEILKPEYDVAKFDCEGCEYFLLDAEDGLIKKIPYWIVEIHNLPNEKADLLKEKFKQNNFIIKKLFIVDPVTELYHFELAK